MSVRLFGSTAAVSASDKIGKWSGAGEAADYSFREWSPKEREWFSMTECVEELMDRGRAVAKFQCEGRFHLLTNCADPGEKVNDGNCLS